MSERDEPTLQVLIDIYYPLEDRVPALAEAAPQNQCREQEEYYPKARLELSPGISAWIWTQKRISSLGHLMSRVWPWPHT